MIKHRKMRFSLTVLGIVIGIAAVVGLVSIGEGMQSSIRGSLEQFGADKIMVFPGSFEAAAGGGYTISLDEKDLDEIRGIKGVKTAAGIWMLSYPVNYRGEAKSLYIAGLDPKEALDFFENIQSFELEDGQWVKENQKYAADIGALVAQTTFESAVEVGNKLDIKDVEFKVIGVLKSTGDPHDDNMLLIPIETMREIFGGGDELTMIFVKASDESRVDAVADDIKKKLEDRYGEDTISAMTSEQIGERVSGIFGILTLVLAAIASISLLVAGVGIANTMYMSVLERTREIGIMKAVGASDWNVLEIFLVESMLIGLIGGIVGCVVGLGLSQLINALSGIYLSVLLKASVSPVLFLTGILFAVLVSTLFGMIPARKAAKLNPVDALRYE